VSVRLYLLAVDGAGMRWYLASVAAFALAVLTHPVSVSCAVVFVVLDLWPARRFPTGPGWWWGAPGRRLWLEKMPYFLLASLFLVTIHARLNPTGIWAPDIKGRTFAPTALVMQAFHVWAHYLWRPWLPFGLAPVYTSLFGFDPLAWPFLVSAAVVIGVTALLLWKRRVFPSALALWACHLLLLIPALGLLEITHYESDRFAYVPGVLWSVALIGLLARLTNPRARRLACAAVAVLVVMAAGASFRQTRVWRDSETLFKYTIESLGPHPYRSDLYWRLGMVYAAEHRGQDAIEQYRKSLAISPGPSARYLLAHALEAQGDLDAALAEYGELLRTHPQAEIFLRVARIRLVQGKTDEAIASFREILRIKPDSLEALDRLAWILSTSDDSAVRNGAEAVRLAGRACDRTGHSTPALLATLAAAQAEAGHLVQAGETARRVLALAQAAGDKRAFELGRVLLARFQSGQPYRDPRR
jgi:tetratricopeptide (TPR) repeat protein